MRYQSTRIPLDTRFWRKVDKTSSPYGCWLWTGALLDSGYGYLQFEGKFNVRVHRISFELAHGSITDGQSICHNCDKYYPVGDIIYRRCVNPAHLFEGTQLDNMQDCALKGRSARGDRNGSRAQPAKRAFGARNGCTTHPERIRRGADASQARLTATQVAEIRARHAAGSTSQRILAIEYGVTFQNINRIVRYKTWKE